MDQSFSSTVIMLSGYRISSQGRFQLRAFLEHWSGALLLTEYDYVLVEKIFPDLVNIAHFRARPMVNSNVKFYIR